MNNNRPPSSNFQKSERETGNQVSLALTGIDGCAQLACSDVFKRLKKAVYTDEGD